ncbi:MAG: hypothetical protein ACMXYF_05810 [Candidatus Woesearchaeota archaeon]
MGRQANKVLYNPLRSAPQFYSSQQLLPFGDEELANQNRDVGRKRSAHRRHGMGTFTQHAYTSLYGGFPTDLGFQNLVEFPWGEVRNILPDSVDPGLRAGPQSAGKVFTEIKAFTDYNYVQTGPEQMENYLYLLSRSIDQGDTNAQCKFAIARYRTPADSSFKWDIDNPTNLAKQFIGTRGAFEYMLILPTALMPTLFRSTYPLGGRLRGIEVPEYTKSEGANIRKRLLSDLSKQVDLEQILARDGEDFRKLHKGRAFYANHPDTLMRSYLVQEYDRRKQEGLIEDHPELLTLADPKSLSYHVSAPQVRVQTKKGSFLSQV